MTRLEELMAVKDISEEDARELLEMIYNVYGYKYKDFEEFLNEKVD